MGHKSIPQWQILRLKTFLSSIMILLMLISPAQAFWELVVGGLVAYFVGKGLINETKEAVDTTIADTDRRIKDRIDQAGDRMDQSTQKAGEELSRRLQEARIILNEMIDKSFQQVASQREEFFRELAAERKEFFTQLDILAIKFEGIESSVLASFDEIVNNALRKGALEADGIGCTIQELKIWPIKRDQLGLRRLVGYGQRYKTRGEYQFRAVGPGFGGERGTRLEDMVIQINSAAIPKEWQFFDDKPCSRVFSLPVETVNSSFSDLRGTPMSVYFKSKDITAERTIILFPKFPVKYTLVIDLTGGRKETIYMRTPGPDFLRSEDEIERKRIAEIRKADPVRAAKLDEDEQVRVRLGEIGNLIQERLPFGASYVELPEDYQNYILDIEWFNGDRTRLHPSHTSGLGVRVSREPINSGKKHRLWVHVDLPTGP